MCGIVGWVDYERDLGEQKPIIEAMTRTMALRGPDAQGIWIDRHAALGHRRLSVIDLEGGAQPMQAAEEGKAVACLTYSGEVYNFVQLRDELMKRGHRFTSRSDTEVVLRSYLEWGESFVDRLVGIYAFAIWDTRKEELLLVRDRVGVKPLFYQPFGSGVLFGSEPKAILAHPDIVPRVGLEGLRHVISMFRMPGDAVYEGMREVMPGHLVRVSRSGIAQRSYWKLEGYEHTDSLGVTIETIRGHLDRIMRQQTVADVPLCSLLSGGLDSSLVTAMADRILRQRSGSAVHSYSVDFADHGQAFAKDPYRDTADTPFVREFVKQVNTRHTEVVLNDRELANMQVRRAVVDALDSAWFVGGDLFPSLYLLFKAVRENSTVALSGEAADEVFGGYRWFHTPETVNLDTFPWMRVAPSKLDTLLSPDLSKELRLKEYEADCYAQALRAVPHVGKTGAEKRMREICHLHLINWLPILLDRKDRMSMAVGLEVRVPFCDHELMQYVFNTPWSMKTFDGREKSLLRAAAGDVVPTAILKRVKSPYPATQDPAYERALRACMGSVISKASPRTAQTFDVDAVRKLIDQPLNEVSIGWERGDIDHALAMSDWLERYDVELV
ncbi:asparagine synthase (glutamine-hydrolyzing) [Paraburkholderia sp. UCT31]|uniref:asparagine synthase (glutamine-hydrolyzing) n=1 Tax=Paraburkholderia sp. UCT31 TaxID=2615209 RepID=UPI00165665D1|nr:asparagine synthase (glutamine-hydrolyzing) [Paraburkholderia sp. UCT31]MBC8741627.1 asparagine synthase (glutamine-hydrolyzing) [Paraburkholderia sp. UCT31]